MHINISSKPCIVTIRNSRYYLFAWYTLENKLKENFTIQIMLKPTASEVEISLLKHNLEATGKFSAINYIPSMKMLEKLS